MSDLLIPPAGPSGSGAARVTVGRADGSPSVVPGGGGRRTEPDDEWLTPIDRYLRDQQTMTAVDRFSRHHDADDLPTQARYYRDLIPLTRPAPGQQYGFEVDLDTCSGCKACVTACHRLNGLDDGESFRSAGALFGSVGVEMAAGAAGETVIDLRTMIVEPWQQTVTSACHHCVDPACLNGCPVDAYEKDPVTGIVKHLDDQCIGCSYCTLTCPYEVPRYSASRGIVRKCDLCSDRLADGEAPACVQACPTSAIRVALVDVVELVAATEADAAAALVPSAPSSRLTVPTTRYRSSRPLPADAVPADHFSLQRAHAHPPLTVMLVLTQLAVGAFVFGLLFDVVAGADVAARVRPFGAGLSLGVGVLALGASTLHLGRPQYAWRAVIGLRHSWLSREIVAFGVFAALAAAYAVAVFVGAPSALARVIGSGVALAGVAGVVCSVMVYAVTGRRWWRVSHTGAKFFLTSIITGASALIVAGLLAGTSDRAAFPPVARELVTPLIIVVMVATAIKLVGEVSIFRHLRDPQYSDLRRTAMLLRDDLAVVSVWRYVCGVVGGLFLPLVLLGLDGDPHAQAPAIVVAMVALVTVTVGELAERWQFFTAITSPRMPGVQG